MQRPQIVTTVIMLAVMLLSACREGDVVVEPDPNDPRPSTVPLVTVIYDPVGLGDRTYNDLIYQGAEEAALEYGLRTMQLSPKTTAEGINYLETMFQQMKTVRDTIRRLFIVASPVYDGFLRLNNHRMDENPYAELLYLESKEPLQGKGSTLYLPYYGAMYEAGAITPLISPRVVLVGANPKDYVIAHAVKGFQDGFAAASYSGQVQEKQLKTVYLSDQIYQGYNAADSTVLKLMLNETQPPVVFIPICGGSAKTFRRFCDVLANGYQYMGIDQASPALNCHFSTVKHVDRAVKHCIAQWLSSAGLPKHQTLGLADGYTETVIHTYDPALLSHISIHLTDAVRARLHEEAIRKEAAYEN